MADIEWKQNSDRLKFAGKTFMVSCKVRNEINKLRTADNIFYTVSNNGTKGSPSQPRIFPVGNWRVTGFRTVSATEDPKRYKLPIFISTNAHQPLDIWEVKDGKYIKNTGQKTEDYAYGLHYSESDYTQGCIRILLLSELFTFVNLFKKVISEIDDPAQKWLSFEVTA